MDKNWGKRIFLIVSAIPLALFVNILRVTGVGVLAHFYGERMAKDFRNAGFLLAGNPASGYTDDTTANSETVIVDASAQPLTINTRAVSGVFGRVEAVPTTTAVGAANTANAFSLVYPEQFHHFLVTTLKQEMKQMM